MFLYISFLSRLNIYQLLHPSLEAVGNTHYLTDCRDFGASNRLLQELIRSRWMCFNFFYLLTAGQGDPICSLNVKLNWGKTVMIVDQRYIYQCFYHSPAAPAFWYVPCFHLTILCHVKRSIYLLTLMCAHLTWYLDHKNLRLGDVQYLVLSNCFCVPSILLFPNINNMSYALLLLL